MVLDHSGLWVNEATESKATDKGDCGGPCHQNCMQKLWQPMTPLPVPMGEEGPPAMQHISFRQHICEPQAAVLDFLVVLGGFSSCRDQGVELTREFSSIKGEKTKDQ